MLPLNWKNQSIGAGGEMTEKEKFFEKANKYWKRHKYSIEYKNQIIGAHFPIVLQYSKKEFIVHGYDGIIWVQGLPTLEAAIELATELEWMHHQFLVKAQKLAISVEKKYNEINR